MEDVLIQEIERLRNENQQLRQECDAQKTKLAAKRYQFIDNIVDTAYKGIRMISRSRTTASDNMNEQEDQKLSPEPKAPAEEECCEIEPGRVDIINVNFYDWDGKTVYKGGAERYVFDLAKLLERKGYKPRILQGAHKDFERDYHGIKVIGLKSSTDDKRELSEIFNSYCRGAEFIIASPDELACRIKNVPCIAINHSIKFTGPLTKIPTELPKYIFNPYGIIQDALRNADRCVCVDTDFINWVRTRDYELSQKLTYIPNYFDSEIFQPQKQKDNDGGIVFVFPRRIEESRGYNMVTEAFRNVIKKYPKTILRLIGQVQDEATQKNMESFIAEFPKNVSHQQFEMEEAYKAYMDADVVLAPTLFMDGTSLTCIEAQASGLPVIATNVGGLPNLIIDHHNGLLISPDAKSLENAMLELIENKNLRKKLGKNALTVAKDAFEKQRWEERWEEVIDDFERSRHER